MYRKVIKFIGIFLVLCLNTAVISGCWDNRDLTELSIVTAVGIDKTKDNKIELTIQIAKPSVIGGTTNNRGQEKPVWTLTTIGDTVFEAVRNSLTILSNKAFYGHIRFIVISEEIAREGILRVLDFFQTGRII